MYVVNDNVQKFYCVAGLIKSGGVVKEKWFKKDELKTLLEKKVIVKKEQEKKEEPKKEVKTTFGEFK